MKRLLVAAFLLVGCVSQQPTEPSKNLDEAYMNAQALYISAISSMVDYKNECSKREYEIRKECWRTVERIRVIAREGMEHRQALDTAYKAGNESDFNDSVAGLRLMRTAIINEVSRETEGGAT